MAAVTVREGTRFPELFPLPGTVLLPPPPPLELPVLPAPLLLLLLVLLLLVLGTELAPPELWCGRLLDIMQSRL